MQAVAPVLSAYDPGAHFAHAAAETAAEALDEVPTGHARQACDPDGAAAYVPAAHAPQTAEPAADEKRPAGHGAQSASELFAQGLALKLPAAQVVHGEQVARPPVEKEVPIAQTVQALEPAGAAEPGPQRPQTASRVSEQAEVGAKPTPQTVHGRHGLPAMLLHVEPATQLVQAVAVPPALELPAAQSVQPRSAVAEPGCAAETTEPAAHVVQAVHEAAPAAEK